MSAIDDFAALLDKTDVMKLVAKTLREEPALILGNVCREYQRTSQPVPDHRLRLTGFFSEASIRALLATGLIKRQPGGTFSVYTYEPTKEGIEQYEKLKNDGFFK